MPPGPASATGESPANGKGNALDMESMTRAFLLPLGEGQDEGQRNSTPVHIVVARLVLLQGLLLTVTTPRTIACVCLWVLSAFPVAAFVIVEPALQAAVTNGLPTNVCYGNRCGPRPAAIWARFENGLGLSPDAVGKLHAGRCFAFGRHLDPEHPHWGGFFIDRTDDGVSFDGRFSFFEHLPDYLSWSARDARRRWTGRHPVQLRDRYAYADLTESLISVRYWFRRASASTDLLLVSYFGFETTILCDLKRLD